MRGHVLDGFRGQNACTKRKRQVFSRNSYAMPMHPYLRQMQTAIANMIAYPDQWKTAAPLANYGYSRSQQRLALHYWPRWHDFQAIRFLRSHASIYQAFEESSTEVPLLFEYQNGSFENAEVIRTQNWLNGGEVSIWVFLKLLIIGVSLARTARGCVCL